MKLGCCVNMLATPQDIIGAKWMQEVERAGFDYIELPMGVMMELSDEAFEKLAKEVDALSIPCDCCNAFMPAKIKITGPNPDILAAEEYLRVSTARAARLGAKYIIFGSAGSKNVPDGFSHETAFNQIVEFLRLAGKYCEQNDICLAIEPLNKLEGNIILNLPEGARLMDAVNHPRVKLLADYFHYELGGETADALLAVCDRLVHTHFAETLGRCFPTEMKPQYRSFFETLINGGYKGRCSIEAYSQNPAKDMARALEVLGEYRT